VHRPDFVVIGEGCFDRQFEHYDASYIRTAFASHRPTSRQLRPGSRMITALTGFDDRDMAAQCLLYGYAPSFEPYNFKGRPGDMPRTLAIADEVRRAQERYAPWLWDGRLLDAPPRAVLDGERSHHPVALWEAEDRPERIAVVANYATDPIALRVDAAALGIADPVLVTVGDRAGSLDHGDLLLPPRSVVLLAEAAVARG
jgi:hypothetical protein